MTSPADNENSAVPFDISELTDSQKLDLIFGHVSWLTAQVTMLLGVLEQNPMARMMMGRKR